MRRAIVFFFILLTAYCLLLTIPVHADEASNIQTKIDANNSQIASLEADIAAYQKQLDALGAQKNTLQSAISALTISQKQLATQIQVTQNKINSENLQIQQLTLSIGDKETTITADQTAIGKALQSMAEGDHESLVVSLLSSQSLSDAWQSADEMVQFNRALEEDIADLSAARTALSTNRDAVTAARTKLVSLKAQLNAQNQSIAQSKAREQELLAETENSEVKYQQLLAAAKAELESFSAFTAAAGGSKLLTNQTVCDSWGCYYNQRDALWGNLPLNGTQYRLASDGCLVTSMAMIMTHYGYRDVTPVTINSNPNNFAAYYPAYLLFTIYVDGMTVTRKSAYLNATLATGNPVIVGLNAYGGTHFIVLTKTNGTGDYLMRDPYLPSARDVSFTAHYSLSQIFSVAKVVISS